MSILHRLQSTVEIDMDIEHATAVFHPGDDVLVTVSMEVREDTAVRGGHAALVYREAVVFKYEYEDSSDDETRSRTETQTVETVVQQADLFGEDVLQRGERCRFILTFTLPKDAASSVDGRLITRAWLLVVTLDRPNALDETATAELVVTPPATGQRRDLATSEQVAELGELVLHLNGDRWHPGDVVAGELIIHPSGDWPSSSVTVELTWHEHVWGRLPTTERLPGYVRRIIDHRHDGRVARLEAARDCGLRSGEALHVPFEIALPITPLPSTMSPVCRLEWQLKVDVSRPFRWRAPFARRSFPITMELEVGPQHVRAN